MTQPSWDGRAGLECDEPALAVMAASPAPDAIPGFLVSDIERALMSVPDPEGTVVALEDGRIVGYRTPPHHDN